VTVVEMVFEYTVVQQIEMGDMQFVFMKGKGMINAIFVVVHGPCKQSSICLKSRLCCD